jgi:hypothetical protein
MGSPTKHFRTLFSKLRGNILEVCLVLAFFLVFLGVIHFLFPEGTGLSDWVRGGGAEKNRNGNLGRLERELLLARGGEESLLSDTETIPAILTEYRKTVKHKRAETLIWRPVELEMPLYDHDAVQTFQDSSAVITFDSENYLEMGENSLVIIKRLEHDPIFREKRSYLVVVDGEFIGKMSGAADSSVQLELTTPTAVARIRTDEASGKDMEFKVKVNTDNSSSIVVYNGEAEIEAQGQRIILGSNQSTTVGANGVPSAPRSLPNPAMLGEPRNSGIFYDRDLPPRIQFRWQAVAEADKYHFMVARDAEFHDIIVNERISRTKFVHGNLKSGSYFWRVRTIVSGFEGPFSETRHFRVVQDRKAPKLQVEFPPPVLQVREYILTGRTDPGTSVYVMGQKIPVSRSGAFEHKLELEAGVNVLVVEALDIAGNTAYESQLVTSKF